MHDHLDHQHGHDHRRPHHDHDHEHHHDHDHGHGRHESRIGAAVRDFWADRKNRVRLGIGVIAAWLLYASVLTVRETEFVLITEFGRPVRTITDAGLHLKWPHRWATVFDRRLRVYNPQRSEFLTKDKKNLVIESYVLWQVSDPETFVQTVGDDVAAERRLHDIIWAGLAAALGTHDLEEIVSPVAEQVRARQMLDELTESTDAAALEQYGIHVADVRIKRLNLPEQNKQSVFARMRAERERIARQYRAEGEEQALRIRAEADREREEIISLAYKSAEETKGLGDAEAARVYGQAYARNPQLYRMVRTLEAYKKTLDEDTTVILSSDSELLRLLTRGQ